jgi:hypothetical protein
MKEYSLGGRPVMQMKRYEPEQIVNLLRQFEQCRERPVERRLDMNFLFDSQC